MSNLILIGTCHHDTKGPERLERLLNACRPSVICLEATPLLATAAMHLHRKMMGKLETLSQVPLLSVMDREIVRKQARAVCYEIWVPKVYKQRHPATKLYYIEQEEAIQKLVSMEEKKHEKKEKVSSSSPSLADIHRLMNSVSSHHKESISITESLYDIEEVQSMNATHGDEFYKTCIVQRDAYFAQQLRKIYEPEQQGNVVAILGNLHFYAKGGKNTYDLLLELHPTRIKLKEADQPPYV